MVKIDVVKVRLEKEKEINIYKENKNIGSPIEAYNIVKEFLENEDREHLICMYLDTKNKINNISTISIGSVNSSIVHPREVFKVAILSNSSHIILAHNHPSGDTTPSDEDCNITKRLIKSGEILGIKVLDHIIVGDDKYISLRERGIVEFY